MAVKITGVGLTAVNGSVSINPTQKLYLSNDSTSSEPLGYLDNNLSTKGFNVNKNRTGLRIDVDYSSDPYTFFAFTGDISDSGSAIVQDWENNNLIISKGNGEYQPGVTFSGRRPWEYSGPIYSANPVPNFYSDISVSSSFDFDYKFSALTNGFNPAQYPLRQGTINGSTIITNAEYTPYQPKEFGAGGVGRIGFCYITFGGNVVIRLQQEAGTYSIAGSNIQAFTDPGFPTQAILDGPQGNVSIAYTPEMFATVSGLAADAQGDGTREATVTTIGKVVKVVGNIESKSSTSGFFCQTDKGYVWATAEHNTNGWLNTNDTTNPQRPLIVWDIYSFDSQDRFASGGAKPKVVLNISSTHDFSDDPDNTGGVVYLKVWQPADDYHELWTTGGNNSSGQLADFSTANNSYATPCMINPEAVAGVSTTGTYVQSNNGTTVGTAGTICRITFAGTDPNLYLGEHVRIDFTTGTSVDDNYEVVAKISAGVYEIQRHTGKNARATTSLTTSGNFILRGRSQVLRALNRKIYSQWSGGGTNGFCFFQDSSFDLWFVGENAAGIAGNATQVDVNIFRVVNGIPKKLIKKMQIGGTDGGFQDAFILFVDGTLWHAGRNTSGYGYGNVTVKTSYTQIAGPGTNTTTIPNAPQGLVKNFWTRPRSSGGAANADSLFIIDYVAGQGWGVFCVGENSNRQLMDNTVTDRTTWVTPTLLPSTYGTAASPSRTLTGWIPEQMWAVSQGPSASNGYFALFRNLTTNEFRIYSWGTNANGLLGNATTTTPTTPIRLSLGVPAYKIKDVCIYTRDTNYDGLGMIITYDGEMFGIGGGRYATAAAPPAYPKSPFWDLGSAESGKYFTQWTKITPTGGF